MKAEKDPRGSRKDKAKLLADSPKKIESVDIILQYLLWIEIKQINEQGEIVVYKPHKPFKSISIVHA